MVRIITLAAIALGSSACVAAPQTSSAAPAIRSTAQQAADNSTPGPSKICKHVVTAEPGSKPYQLCLTKAEWEAKEKADSRNANRTVCRYVEHSGSIFKSYKVCMTAAEWENKRQLDRQQLERIQQSTCVRGGGC
ncbi:hypothetical protein [Sphingomonas sp.]|uniref:hypothetical protein n=1 Tax=Sphingomonas sp. TaxID=28214 RepID=UPI0017FC676B|nr:hypothetical protein [Sphingomonas sp.]MBA3511494.1 hypothetical protein [Sphingomonas sp.]